MPSNNSQSTEELYSLDRRTVVVEVKLANLEEKVENTLLKVDHINESVGKIEKHIAAQNGSLPRIEKSLETALQKFQTSEEKNTETSIKQKILWKVLFTIGTLLISSVIGYLFHLFSNIGG